MPDQNNRTDFEELYLQVQRKVAAEWHKRLDQLISGSQSMILRMLEVSGPQKVSTLAERLCITPGAVTSLSDKLISCGYATRKRDTVDRRVVNLEITEKGRTILRQYRKEVKSTVEYFFAGLSDEDIDHLTRIYQQVLKNIDTQKEEYTE
ncbi:MarR family winged helix-turn-helix transcriptional regulator [Aneurinibacillus sp. REN35]|uniref:MarR family winged helix-turn-helix transcriptional regulator n=1 Tax=Aneurinibacillus sp. REN35 TaxID=3237286 RepID=UPI003529C400